MRETVSLAVCLLALTACADDPHRATPAPRDTVELNVQADGRYALMFRGAKLRDGRLDIAASGAADGSAAVIRQVLSQLVEAPGLRDPSGRSTLTLHQRLAPEVPWRVAMALVKAAADPSVRIGRHAFSLPDDEATTVLDLPDGGKAGVWGGVYYGPPPGDVLPLRIDATGRGSRHVLLRLETALTEGQRYVVLVDPDGESWFRIR